jgi:hypothetical protein
MQGPGGYFARIQDYCEWMDTKTNIFWENRLKWTMLINVSFLKTHSHTILVKTHTLPYVGQRETRSAHREIHGITTNFLL